MSIQEHPTRGQTERRARWEALSYLVVDVRGTLGGPILHNIHRMPIVATHLLIVGTEGRIWSPTSPQSYP